MGGNLPISALMKGRIDMDSFSEDMKEFHAQLRTGEVQRAYRGLMQFMLDLKTRLGKTHPELAVSGGLYPGYMDMTYFAIVTEELKKRNLKIAVVFVYEAFRFEVWLSGVNRQVQAQVWEMIKEQGWEKFRLVDNPKVADAVIEHVLVEDPDFGDLPALTTMIENGIIGFIRDVERFFLEHE